MKQRLAQLRADGTLRARPLLCRTVGLYLLSTAANVPLVLTVCVLLIGTAVLTVIHQRIRTPLIDSSVALSGLLCFGASALWGSADAALYTAVTLFVLITAALLVRPQDFSALRPLSKRTVGCLCVLIPCMLCGLISVLCICRYQTYRASCFDLGIFAQMFHSMKTDLTQITTCERNTLLSHSAVHLSPIYYLLLPLYALFPATETLLIEQSVLVLSGVIPLCLLGRQLSFGRNSLLALCVIYCTAAPLLAPCLYDIHENAFLPPLLLWFVYAMERRCYPAAALSGLLILLVKEDAPLYLFCLGLYHAAAKKHRTAGIVTLCAAAAYFTAALFYLDRSGEGAMIYRTYAALMTDPNDGMLHLIGTVLRHPQRLLAVCFTAEKIPFLCAILLMLLGFPLRSKSRVRLWLCLPFVLMNLAPSYPYAADLGFQYVFGTYTCLLIAALFIVAELPERKRRKSLAQMTIAALLGCICFVSPQLSYVSIYQNEKTQLAQIDAALDSVPPDASVCADTRYLPHLAQRSTLYLLDYTQPDFFACDYIVFDPTVENAVSLITQLTDAGYIRQPDAADAVELYHKTDIADPH